jgi:enoyl-[acyl-carrier protein] reductase II
MVRANKNSCYSSGGIANGRGMLAAMALGADGVQVGSRFAASMESA